MMTRISSGIEGLDPLLEGGFPFPSVILVSGSPGCGKTTFAQKFLCQGAARGEQCLYITTLSEPTQCMLRYAEAFEFIDKEWFGDEIVYEDIGHRIRNATSEQLLDSIDKMVGSLLPERIVIDPISVVRNLLKDDYRLFLFDLTTRLKNWQTTALLTGEVSENEVCYSELAYAADGVIVLSMSFDGDATRKYLEVVKMRGTNHATGKSSFAIDRKDGIRILKTKF